MQDEQGRTALHQAAIEETSFWGTELAALFLSQKLPDLIAVRDNNGETALDIARRLEKKEIVNLLQTAAADAENGQVDAPTDEATAELQQLLRARSWAAADRETRRLLAPDSVVTRSALEASTITPALIRAIDQAWLAASNGRFGLSVQVRLWQDAQAAHPNDRDAAVNALRDRLGWKISAPRPETDFISSDWRNESELTYSLDAPAGHLPWVGVSDAVVQAVAVPPPGQHCGSCTIDAMALRDSRFYGHIPALMDKVQQALNPPAASSWQSPRLRQSLDLAALHSEGAQGTLGPQAVPVAFAISPDSQLLAVSSSSGDPTRERHALALWNLEKGTRRITLIRPGNLRAETVMFSPNSRLLWAGLANGDVAGWDTAQGATKKQWNAHRGEVSAIALTPDGNTLYTGGADGTVKVWSPNGQLSQTLRLSAGEVNPSLVRALLLSPNGRQLAVATDRTIQLWGTNGRLIKVTAQTTAQTGALYSPALANSMAFSPDGRHFATLDTDRSVKLWNAENGARFITLRGPAAEAQALAFTPDGNTLLVRDSQQSVVYWNLKTYQRDRTISVATGNRLESIDTNEATALQQPITFSPDGETFVVPLMLPSSHPALDIRRTDTGERLTVLDWVSQARFSPDNRWLVAREVTIQIWQP